MKGILMHGKGQGRIALRRSVSAGGALRLSLFLTQSGQTSHRNTAGVLVVSSGRDSTADTQRACAPRHRTRQASSVAAMARRHVIDLTSDTSEDEAAVGSPVRKVARAQPDDAEVQITGVKHSPTAPAAPKPPASQDPVHMDAPFRLMKIR